MAAPQKTQGDDSDLLRQLTELNDILDLVPSPLSRIAPDGTILWANQAELALFGHRLEEYVGRNARDFLAEPDHPSLNGHLPKERSALVRCADGSLKPTLFALHPTKSGGEPQEYLRVARADLQDAGERFSRFMEHLPASAWIKDRYGRYVYANPVAEQVFRTRLQDLVGKTDSEIFPAETAASFQANDREVMRSGRGIRVVETLEHADGPHQSVVSKFPIHGAGGEVAYVCGVAMDVTDRLRAEEALRRTEQRLNLAMAAGQMGAWDWNIREGTISWSPTLELMHGLAPGTFGGTFEAFQADMHPEDRARVLHTVQTALATGTDYHVEYRILNADGHVRWLEARGKLVRGPGGEPERMTGICSDVTARRQTDDAIRESEERFRSLANSAPVLIWVSGTSNEGTFFNQRWLEFTGRSLEEELGDGWIAGVHPDDLPALKVCERAFDERHSFTTQFRLKRADGVYRWILDTGVPRFSPDGQFLGLIGSCLDITDQQEAERKLMLLVQASGDLLSSTGQAAVREAILRHAQQLVSADAYAIWQKRGENVWEIVASRGLSAEYETQLEERGPDVAQVLAAPHSYVDVAIEEAVRIRLEAHRREGIRAMLTIPMTLHGETSGTLVFYRRTPEAFSAEEKRLGAALGNLAAGALATSELYERQRDLRIQAQQAEQRQTFLAEITTLLSSSLEYSKTLESLARQTIPFFADFCAIDVLLGADGREADLSVMHHAVPEKGAAGLRVRSEFGVPDAVMNVFRTGDSLLLPEVSDPWLTGQAHDPLQLALFQDVGLRSILIAPLRARGRILGVITFGMADSGRRYSKADQSYAENLAERAGISIDNARLFTELQEERSRVAQANASLAETNQALRRANVDLEQFAYSASHDLKEPIRQVAIFSELLAEKVSGDQPEVTKYAQLVHSGAKRIDSLVDDLRAYMGSGSTEIQTSLIDTNAVLEACLRSLDHLLQQSSAELTNEPLPHLPIAAVHLEQLLQNLLSNAIKYRSQAPLRIAIACRREDGCWLLSVRDNGIGIEPAYHDHVFGLFKRLHTDSAYPGTGIGLALCKRIIERYGGSIWVDSEPGQGSTFTLRLPEPRT